MSILDNLTDNDKQLIKLLLGSDNDNFLTFYKYFMDGSVIVSDSLKKQFIYSDPCDDECISENFVKMILFIASYHAYVNYWCMKLPSFNKDFKKLLNKYLPVATPSIAVIVIQYFNLHVNIEKMDQYKNEFLRSVLISPLPNMLQIYSKIIDRPLVTYNDVFDIILDIGRMYSDNYEWLKKIITLFSNANQNLLSELDTYIKNTPHEQINRGSLVREKDAIDAKDASILTKQTNIKEKLFTLIQQLWVSQVKGLNKNVHGYNNLYKVNTDARRRMARHFVRGGHDVHEDHYVVDYNMCINPEEQIRNNQYHVSADKLIKEPRGVNGNLFTVAVMAQFIFIFKPEDYNENFLYVVNSDIENSDIIIVYLATDANTINKDMTYTQDETTFITDIVKKTQSIPWSCVSLTDKDEFHVRSEIRTKQDGQLQVDTPQPKASVNIVVGHLYNNTMLSLGFGQIDAGKVTNTIKLGDGITIRDMVTKRTNKHKDWDCIYRFSEPSRLSGQTGGVLEDQKLVLADGELVDIKPVYGTAIDLPVVDITKENKQAFINYAREIQNISVYDSKELLLRSLKQNDNDNISLSEYIKRFSNVSSDDQLADKIYDTLSGEMWYVANNKVYKYDKSRANVISRSYHDLQYDPRYKKDSELLKVRCDNTWSSISKSDCNYWNEWITSISGCKREDFTALRKKYAGDTDHNIQQLFKDVPLNHVTVIHPQTALSILKFFNFKNVTIIHPLGTNNKKYKRLQKMEEWLCKGHIDGNMRQHGIYKFLSDATGKPVTEEIINKFVNDNKDLYVFLCCLRRIACGNGFINLYETDPTVMPSSIVPVGVIYNANKPGSILQRKTLIQLGGTLRKLLHLYDISLTPITIGVSNQNGGSVHFPNGLSTFLSTNDKEKTYKGILVGTVQKGGQYNLLNSGYIVDESPSNPSYLLKRIWNNYKQIISDHNIELTNQNVFEEKLNKYEELHKDVQKTLQSLNKLVKYINVYPKQYDSPKVDMKIIDELINRLNLTSGRITAFERKSFETMLSSINHFPLVVNSVHHAPKQPYSSTQVLETLITDPIEHAISQQPVVLQ